MKSVKIFGLAIIAGLVLFITSTRSYGDLQFNLNQNYGQIIISLNPQTSIDSIGLSAISKLILQNQNLNIGGQKESIVTNWLIHFNDVVCPGRNVIYTIPERWSPTIFGNPIPLPVNDGGQISPIDFNNYLRPVPNWNTWDPRYINYSDVVISNTFLPQWQSGPEVISSYLYAVPEPCTLLLLGLGAVLMRKKK